MKTFKALVLLVLLFSRLLPALAQDSVIMRLEWRQNSSLGARNVAVDGDYVYVAAEQSGLRILNIVNPEAPVEAGLFDFQCEDLKFTTAGHYAFLAGADSGLRIIDVSNPDMPVEIGAYNHQIWANDVAVANNYAYVADYMYGLRIIDIMDPADPFEAGTYQSNGPNSAVAVAVAEPYVYLVDYAGYLRIINVNNPELPFETGHYILPNGARSIAVAGANAYMATGTGLQIINISDPANPVEAGHYDIPTACYRVAVAGEYAFVAAGLSCLRIIDISNPANPVEAGRYENMDVAYDVAIAGSYVYVAENACFSIYRYSTVTGAKDKPTVLPRTYALYSCYPNPFNPSTQIDYDLRQAGLVSLNVYNLLGQKVATLVNGHVTQGQHSVTFDAQNLPSGVYVCKLETNGFVDQKKMTLVK